MSITIREIEPQDNAPMSMIIKLSAAVSAYEKLGFKLLDKPVGDTGHYSCSIWMLYKIK